MSSLWHAGEVQQDTERQVRALRRRGAHVDEPRRVVDLLGGFLVLERIQHAGVFVDLARDDIEIEPLRGLRLLEHEVREAFRRRVAQPFFDREAIAARLGNLFAVFVQEKLVRESSRRVALEDAADFPRQVDAVDQVLARHFIIDVERCPAHGPVGLPLQLAMAAGDRRFDLRAVFVLVNDSARVDVGLDDRDLQDDTRRRADRQERGIGLAAFFARVGRIER